MQIPGFSTRVVSQESGGDATMASKLLPSHPTIDFLCLSIVRTLDTGGTVARTPDQCSDDLNV